MARSSNALALVMAAALLLSACGSKPKKPTTPAKPPVATKPATKPASKPADKPVAAKPVEKPADKGDPEKRFAEATALLKENQIAEAEAAFKSLSEDFPTFSGPFTELGILYAKSNRKELAMSALSRAVTLNVNNAIAYNYLGMLYRDAKDYARAEKAYLASLKANPNSALAHRNLGILYDDALKRPADALPHYKEYQRLGGKDDLAMMAWVAEIEAVQKAAAPVAPAPAAVSPRPEAAPAKPAAKPRPSTRPKALEGLKQ